MEELRGCARESLERARRQVGETADPVDAETRVVDGYAGEELCQQASRERAALIAVGAHGGRRIAGVALGSVATMLLHDAPASVLLTRTSFDPIAFPERIVVGFDGSEGARHALDLASRLRERARGSLSVLVATRDDEDGDLAELRRLAAPHQVEAHAGRPVEALVEAAETADLLVVGARGVRGIRSLGSVSERVAHRASSSVLVVRPQIST